MTESERRGDRGRRSVLVVEDEAVVALDLRQTLEEMGYEVVGIASTADEALAFAAERFPDIALMDVRISGPTDGVGAAHSLRERFDIPVVFLTAHADSETLTRAKDAAPYGYLLKPLKYGELRSTVEVALVRHDLERHVRQRERWFSTTLRSIADAVVAVDLQGRVTFMNRAAQELTGVAASEGMGLQARDVVRLASSIDGGTVAPLDLALQSRATVVVREATLTSKDAVRRLIADSASPVEDERGLLGAVMVFRDITRQHEDQMKLELADRLASLGTLAAGVAHEINNPLAVIVLSASYVADQLKRLPSRTDDVGGASRYDADTTQRAMADIAGAAQRIKRIVGDLTTFARPTPIPGVGAEIARAVDWAVRSTKHQSDVPIETDIGDVPNVALDEVRLGQLLVNLIVNALHAVEATKAPLEGFVRIRAKREGEASVVLEVSDSGVGMSPEQRSRAFEPFFTTKSQGVGVGLGLSICRGIVDGCGGQLEIDSFPGRGTTVRAVLPIAGSVRSADRTNVAEGVPVAGGQRARILVVDDEPAILRAIKSSLAEYDVTCIDDGAEALALLERGASFDLAIVDLMMPRLGGIELYERIRATNPSFASRIVFATGAKGNAAIRPFLETVPNVCLEKPFSRDALLDAVRAALEANPPHLQEG